MEGEIERLLSLNASLSNSLREFEMKYNGPHICCDCRKINTIQSNQPADKKIKWWQKIVSFLKPSIDKPSRAAFKFQRIRPIKLDESKTILKIPPYGSINYDSVAKSDTTLTIDNAAKSRGTVYPSSIIIT